MKENMRIVFTDTETTGLDRQHQVIQLAAIEVVHREDNPLEVELVKEYECKFMPDDPDNPMLGKYNSYNKTVWKKEAIPRSRGIMNYFKFLEKKTFGGQNPCFDWRMLDEERRRLDLSWPVMANYRMVAVEMYAHPLTLLGYLKNAKQETAAKFLGLGAQTHDALDDVRQSIEIYRRLLWLSANGISPNNIEVVRRMPLLQK